MDRETQSQKILIVVLAWVQAQGWGSIEPSELFWLEQRDLEIILEYLPTSSCTYVLLRIIQGLKLFLNFYGHGWFYDHIHAQAEATQEDLRVDDHLSLAGQHSTERVLASFIIIQ